MWTLKNEAGEAVYTGTGPCTYDDEYRGWLYQGTLYPDLGRHLVLEDLGASITAAVARIDVDVDAIHGAAIGLRQAEYEAAEREAQAYADAGCEGPVPGMVHSWAIAKAWAPAGAADDILAVAGQWRGAQELIRAQRLLRKEQVRGVVGPAGLAATLATWAGFVAAVRAQLGIGGT